MKVSEQYEYGKLPGIENKLVLTNGETTYVGFFSAKAASYITFEDCILTGRRGYQRPAANGNGGGGMGGTYDLAVNEANAVTYKNCNQHNFWITIDSNCNVTPATETTPGAVTSMQQVTVNGNTFRMHWGIGGTNFSKNIVYDGSTLSRYDAHAGLYNGKVINSTVNYLALTGNGEFIIEDTKWVYTGESDSIIALRSDYGCTWDGEVTIKNVTAYITSKTDGIQVCAFSYKNWYYGYMVGFPSITIDNLKVYNMDTKQYLPSGSVMNVTSIAINATDSYSVAQNLARIHLEVSHAFPIIPILDYNKDGYIDEFPTDINRDGIVDPVLDIDGNGVAGETGLNYQTELDGAGTSWESGIKLMSAPIYHNLNIVKPPKYIKIINNEAGYVYRFPRTDGGEVSDGMWYDEDEKYGGFFGDTKFYYGPGENDYVVGTKAGYDQNIPNYEFYLG